MSFMQLQEGLAATVRLWSVVLVTVTSKLRFSWWPMTPTSTSGGSIVICCASASEGSPNRTRPHRKTKDCQDMPRLRPNGRGVASCMECTFIGSVVSKRRFEAAHYPRSASKSEVHSSLSRSMYAILPVVFTYTGEVRALSFNFVGGCASVVRFSVGISPSRAIMRSWDSISDHTFRFHLYRRPVACTHTASRTGVDCCNECSRHEEKEDWLSSPR